MRIFEVKTSRTYKTIAFKILVPRDLDTMKPVNPFAVGAKMILNQSIGAESLPRIQVEEHDGRGSKEGAGFITLSMFVKTRREIERNMESSAWNMMVYIEK